MSDTAPDSHEPDGSCLDAFEEQVAVATCSTAGRPFLVGYKGHQVTVWRPDCKMWKCAYCGRKNANHLVHVIAYGVHVYQTAEPWRPWSFVTLTARGDRRGMTHSLEDFRTGWPKLRKRITRHYHYPLRFAAVPERHADAKGTIHMHMLLNIVFDDVTEYTKRDGSKHWRSRWLARHATASGLGWSHDCRPLVSETAAVAYMVKYAMKHVADADWPSNMMHYRTSQHWPRHDDGQTTDDSFKWIVVQPPNLYRVLDNFKQLGYTITDHS